MKDVLVIANPLMDQMVFVDEDQIKKIGVKPGSMSLVELEEADRLVASLAGWALSPGGSETNTAVGVAALGGTVKLLGAIADDELGQRYRDDLRQYPGLDINFEVYPMNEYHMKTGASYILVLPDGERTMMTYLGASSLLSGGCISQEDINKASTVYFDAYLLDLPAAEAILDALFTALQISPAKVIFGLADVNVVERQYEKINDLIGKIDVLLANDSEISTLMRTDDIEAATVKLANSKLQVAVTLGSKGALVRENNATKIIEAIRVEDVVDTTGAGDQFAAGICFGISNKMSLEDAARIGVTTAAEVIGHLGARPLAAIPEL